MRKMVHIILIAFLAVFLIPAQLYASPEDLFPFTYVATKDGLQLSDESLNKRCKGMKIFCTVKSNVKSGGLSPKEAEEAIKFLHLQDREHALMKIEGQDGVKYYITERTDSFHQNTNINFSLYRYFNDQADILWKKEFEQEGVSGGCYNKQQRKKEMRNRSDGRFPNKITSSSLFHFDKDRARITAFLMNCETRKTYLEYVEFTAHNGYISISNY